MPRVYAIAQIERTANASEPRSVSCKEFDVS